MHIPFSISLLFSSPSCLKKKKKAPWLRLLIEFIPVLLAKREMERERDQWQNVRYDKMIPAEGVVTRRGKERPMVKGR